MSVAFPTAKARKSSLFYHPKARDRSRSLPTTTVYDQADCLFFAFLPAEVLSIAW